MNDKVYLVVYSDYDTFTIYGVATTKQKAEKMIEVINKSGILGAHETLDIQEEELDSLGTWFEPSDPRSKV